MCVRHTFHTTDWRSGERNVDRGDTTSERRGKQDSVGPAFSSHCRAPTKVCSLPAVTRPQPRQISRDLRTDDGGAAGWRQRRTLVQHFRRHRSVDPGVCQAVCHAGGLCKNGWTDRRLVQGGDSRGPQNIVLDGHPPPPRRWEGVRCGLYQITLAICSICCGLVILLVVQQVHNRWNIELSK